MVKKKIVEWIGTIRHQDKRGHEIPDPNPIAIPSGFKRPETLAEQVQRLVRNQASREAAEAGEESWEDFNDFDVDDDFDPSSPWETTYDPELGREISPAEFKEHWPEIKTEMARNLRNAYRLEELERTEKELIAKSENRGAGVSPAPSSDPPAKQ